MQENAEQQKRNVNRTYLIASVGINQLWKKETLSKDPFVHVSHEELLQGVSNTDVLVGDIEVPIVIVECQY